MSEPFLGQISWFPYGFAPYGWIECAGQTLAISQNAALFSLLGTFYGGNGTSKFQLPDLQGRVGVNQGQGPGLQQYSIGEAGGGETVTLTQAQLAQHSHSLNAATAHGTTNAPSGAVLATGQTGSGRDANTASFYNAASPNTTLAPASIGPAGNSVPHNNVQPFLVVRPCIALRGVFPSRG